MQSWPGYDPMGTGTLWISSMPNGYRYQMGPMYYYGPMISVSGLLVNETPTPIFCRCEVGNVGESTPSLLKIECFEQYDGETVIVTATLFFCIGIRISVWVFDSQLLGDLTFWFVGGCDPHPVLLDLFYIFSVNELFSDETPPSFLAGQV